MKPRPSLGSRQGLPLCGGEQLLSHGCQFSQGQHLNKNRFSLLAALTCPED